MKSKNRIKTALILCDRCIRALKSRGEQAFVGDFDNNGNIHTCMWCEAPDDELFEVIFDAYSDFGAYYNG